MSTPMSKRVPGVFVVIEGADGSGKSTIVQHVIDLLQRDGVRIRRTTRIDPDGQQAYAQVVAAVKGLFDAADELLTPLHLLGLAAATQYAVIAQSQALDAVKAGEIVIAESWWAKTWARLVVEGRRCLHHDDAASLEFARWLQSLLAYPSFQQTRDLTVLIESAQDDRVRWYSSSNHHQPVYGRFGQTTTDPQEFGEFTSEIQEILRRQAQAHGWHVVANRASGSVSAVAAQIVALVHRRRHMAD